MMADSIQGVASNGGGSGKRTSNGGGSGKRTWAREAHHAWAYHHARKYAHRRAYISLAVKASGLLAVLLSTVILLGGYVQSLGKKDFFCILAITVIQATGIFQEWENNLRYVDDFREISTAPTGRRVYSFVSPLAVLVFCAKLFYLLGPWACAAISSWRIAKLNHGNHSDGTDSTADMMATLNIFYSLIIVQGAMSLVLLVYTGIHHGIVVRRLLVLEQLSEKWAEEAIDRYLSHISTKCRNDPLSIKGLDLMKYAAEFLDSESQEDYLLGAMLLCAFIKQGRDVSRVLLTSKKRIKKLVDSLWVSNTDIDLNEDTEVRELAATIVVDLAGRIDVAMYPGALRYISYLLQEETTQTIIWNRSEQACHQQTPQQEVLKLGPFEFLFQSKVDQMENLIRREEEHQWRLMRRGRVTTSNELILKGLAFLERLASNRDNCRLICSTPGLLPKITAPLYSDTLIQDVKTKVWADIVIRCLKVLYQLISDPGWPREIFSYQALRNLKSMLFELDNNDADHQLQLVTMEILTKLALDFPMDITREIKDVLIKKLLELFVNEVGEESAPVVLPGRTLVSLSADKDSALIMITQNDILDLLTGILDDEDITRRTIAAEIMANLCANWRNWPLDYNLTKRERVLLPKVLREILSINIRSQERKASADQKIPALADVENQGNSLSTKNTEEWHNISTQGNDTEIEEISHQEREEQEAFLSLAQVICDKMNHEDLDGTIQKAFHWNNARSEWQRREAFVDMLKTIIEDNCHPTADSLRIVKLCGQIAISVIQCKEYVEIFRNKGFKSSLSKASETMSKLESCMLFVGTDFGHKKTLRPLLSKIEGSFGDWT